MSENDGRDLALSTYLADGDRFVTEDARLRDLLQGILEAPARVIPVAELLSSSS